MTDVFISYSRKNSDFARRLTDKLRQSGKDSWVDWEGIPLSSPNWWGEIQTGIDKADNFVFIMSPDSMSSVVCHMELDYALDHNKRVVVVVHQDVERTDTFATMAEYIPDAAMEERLGGDTPIEKARDNWTRISHINWLFFRENDDFDEAYQKLLDTVATDLDYVKAHTRYLDRAQDWIRSGKREDLLLFGDEIALGEAWLEQGKAHARDAEQRSAKAKIDVVNPLPDQLHYDYIAASREAENERQRRLQELEDSRKRSEEAAATADKSRRRAQVIGAIAGVIGVVAILAGVFAGIQAADANNQAQVAASTADQAEIIAATADTNRQTAVAAGQIANEQSTQAFFQQATLAVQADDAAATADGAQVAAAQALEAEGTANAQITQAVEQQATLAVEVQDAAATADGAQVAAAQALEAEGTANAQITQAVEQQATLAREVEAVSTQVADANALLAAVTPTLNAVATTIREVENFASAAQLAARADTTFNRGNSQPLGLALAMEAAFIDTPAIVNRTLQDIAYQPSVRLGFNEHWNWVISVAVSPDGRLAASGDRDAMTLIWEIETGRLVAELQEHDGNVTDLAFSPDGRLLATASVDRNVILWDVASGEVVRTLERHNEAINAIAFSPDGTTLASVADDTMLILWDVATGEIVQEIEYDEPMLAIDYSPNGRVVITGSEDGFLSLWDSTTGDLIEDRREHTGPVTAVNFSPDGQFIATASKDATIKLWRRGQRASIATLMGHPLSVNDVAFSPDGRQLISVSEDQTVILWDVDTRQIVTRYRGHNDWISAVAFTPDGQQVLTASDDLFVYVWDTTRGDLMLDLTNRSIGKVTMSADGRLIASITPDDQIAVIDVTTGTVLRLIGADLDAGYFNVAMSEDGSRLVASSFSGLVTVWDVASSDLLHEWDFGPVEIDAVDLSPDGSRVLVGTFDGTIALLDAQSGEEINSWDSELPFVRVVSFTPDGQHIALGGSSGAILREIESLDVVQFYPVAGQVLNLVFSADQSRLVTSGDEGNVRLWDTESGEQIQTYTGLNSEIFGLSYSPDETEILAGSNEGQILRWDAASTELIQSIPAHNTLIYDAFYLPGGQSVLSSSFDGSLKIFRIRSLAETQQWVLDNRYVPEFTCEQRVSEGLAPCVDGRTPSISAAVTTDEPEPMPATSIQLDMIDLAPEPDYVAENGVNSGQLSSSGSDLWVYQGIPNGIVDIRVASDDFDPMTDIKDEIGVIISSNDDINDTTFDSGFSLYRLPPSGLILIRISDLDEGASGNYTLTITTDE